MGKIAKDVYEAAKVSTKCRGFKEAADKHSDSYSFAKEYYQHIGTGQKIMVEQMLVLGNTSPLFNWFEGRGVTEPWDMVYHVLRCAWCMHKNEEFNLLAEGL